MTGDGCGSLAEVVESEGRGITGGVLFPQHMGSEGDRISYYGFYIKLLPIISFTIISTTANDMPREPPSC